MWLAGESWHAAASERCPTLGKAALCMAWSMELLGTEERQGDGRIVKVRVLSW